MHEQQDIGFGVCILGRKYLNECTPFSCVTPLNRLVWSKGGKNVKPIITQPTLDRNNEGMVWLENKINMP